MIQKGDKICVALSGGADSVALLHVLYSLKDELDFSLSALHINHMLRGEESDRDERFAIEICDLLGVEITVKTVNVNALCEKSGESVELTARNARYEMFSQFTGFKIATAHTATDNVETVLINLTRGTALKGLCGIPPIRDNIVRPLIDCTREEVEDYCAQNGLSFVTDSTNLSDDYTRNLIRHNVTPVLRNINPSFSKTVRRSCENIAFDADFLSKVADELYCKNKNENSVSLPPDTHRAISSRVIGKLIFDVTGKNADSLHINEVCGVLGKNKKIELFAGYSATVKKCVVTIEKSADQPAKEFYVSKQTLAIKDFKNLSNVNNLLLKSAIDCDKICGEIILRTRKTGDSIKLCGRNGTKDLRKLYNECKIPLTQRKNLPVAADDGGVVWVCGVGVSERVCVDKNTKTVLLFEHNMK
ncbi:MAG: tRNA lysidine(34) synthetase TilS [Acutalibacteraceae bacterium]|nr:tRNA lysidine(34) synthetase TilS [Acutalibacteraceae bacterium]